MSPITQPEGPTNGEKVVEKFSFVGVSHKPRYQTNNNGNQDIQKDTKEKRKRELNEKKTRPQI